jgi:Zn-finger protein
MIANKGHTIVFDSNKCLIIHNKDLHTIVAKGVRDPKNGLYKLEMHSIKSFEETQETYIVESNLKESINSDKHQTLF